MTLNKHLSFHFACFSFRRQRPQRVARYVHSYGNGEKPKTVQGLRVALKRTDVTELLSGSRSAELGGAGAGLLHARDQI